MSTLYQLKNHLAEMGEEVRRVNDELRKKLKEHGAPMEEIRNMKAAHDELEERYNMLKAEVDKEEARHKAKMEAEAKRLNPTGEFGKSADEQRKVAAKADMIRSAIRGEAMGEETRNLLAAIPVDDPSGGAKLLPTNMTNQLIHEPMATNPMRSVVQVSNITGLEEPKILFELDDDNFITDHETAKEIEMTGDKITFGRNKIKVKARLADTVLHGSDTNLVATVENALNSGIAVKEKKVMFAETPEAGQELMSFYSTQNAIKRVSGASLWDGITQAIADLHENYRENAKVVMRYADYVTMLKELANNSATLFHAQPESVIGKPVIFVDSAVKPIVGDFSYARLNYDNNFVYDTDKDVDKGEYRFVLTGWFDFRVKLASAFRIVDLEGGDGGNDGGGNDGGEQGGGEQGGGDGEEVPVV